MQEELKEVYQHMINLGMSALSHAALHSNYTSWENDMWPELAVLQAAHSAEILIKARIAQEHPLLIFDKIPNSPNEGTELLTFEYLIERGKTIQYSDLPERLWATTGIKLKDIELFSKFGMLRNKIQHFASPKDIDCGTETLKFIFNIIDPFINECWGLYAIDHNEHSEEYKDRIERLIEKEIYFLVPPDSILDIDDVDFDFSENDEYKVKMIKRFNEAGYSI